MKQMPPIPEAVYAASRSGLLCLWVVGALVCAGVAGADEAWQEYRRLLERIEDRRPAQPYIVIDTQDNRLLLRGGDDEVLQEAVCATGSGRKFEGPKKWKHNWIFDTPKGRFSIRRKVEAPVWIKPEWAFLEEGAEIPVFAEDRRRFEYGVLGDYALYFLKDYMIHGTIYEVNLGKSITHGCVRLGGEDLRRLYERTGVGSPVYIY